MSQVESHDDVLTTHYTDLADRYDEFLYWSTDFVGCHADKIVEQLELEENDLLVDLAGGTGMYSLAVLDRVPLREPVIVVDPFEEMLAHVPEEAPIRTVAADVVDFSTEPADYDKILMKEAIHHVDRKEELFENLRERLRPGGRMLLVHVDPRHVAYPLFDLALDRCRERFVDPDDLASMLADAGFKVEVDLMPYDHKVAKERYFEMVAGRYMSPLTSLEHDELESGLAEMAKRHAGADVLEFTETFDYVLATKP